MGDKRFPPTRSKRERERKAGNVARSRILGVAIGLFLNFSVLYCLTPLYSLLLDSLRQGLRGTGDLIEQNGRDFRTNNMLVSAQDAVWVYGCGAGFPLILFTFGSLLQHRVLVALLGGAAPWSGAQLLPKVSRLDPVNGFRRIFGPNGVNGRDNDATTESGRWPTRILSEILKSAAVHGAVVAVLWQRAAQGMTPVTEIDSLWTVLCRETVWICGTVVGGWTVIGIGELLLERALHAKRLRMDLNELRKELRQSEGNPEQRALRRQLQQALQLHELVQGVRKARVLVVNGARGQ